jgi:hypothetical protein
LKNPYEKQVEIIYWNVRLFYAYTGVLWEEQPGRGSIDWIS